ncbi:EamA family transporter [Candidatus Woesearchaeota archaeon]|nr:EamA family transporter [Candidatus Woesearchaeota archaeon]
MELWIIYSLIAAVAFGASVIVYKLGFRGNPSPFLAELLFGAGIIAVFLIAWLMNKPDFSVPFGSGLLLVIAGIIWAAGYLMITLGVARNFEISKMSLIYNLNFIIAVLLGILVLKELQSTRELIRTLLGAAVMIVGILIVSLK